MTDVIDGVNVDWHGRISKAVVNGIVTIVYIDEDHHIATIAAKNKLRFSNDYGETWTAANKYLDGSDVTGSDSSGEPYLFAAPNGNLIIHLGRGWTASPNGGTWQVTSTDGGKTWSEAAPISISGIVGDANYLNLIDDSFIYGDDIYISGRISTDVLETNCKSVICKSTDNGETWTWIGDITTAGQTNEVGIELTPDGWIAACLRAAGSSMDTYRAFSSDLGVTWVSVNDIVSRIGRSGKQRMFTVAHLKGEANWWTDARLVRCGFEFNGTQRRNAIWVSGDAGWTWILAGYLDDWTNDGGYGDVFYNPNTGEYVCINYAGTDYATSVKQYNFRLT